MLHSAARKTVIEPRSLCTLVRGLRLSAAPEPYTPPLLTVSWLQRKWGEPAFETHTPSRGQQHGTTACPPCGAPAGAANQADGHRCVAQRAGRVLYHRPPTRLAGYLPALVPLPSLPPGFAPDIPGPSVTRLGLKPSPAPQDAACWTGPPMPPPLAAPPQLPPPRCPPQPFPFPMPCHTMRAPTQSS